jgi:predicted glycogen debranching enzyme
MGYSLGRDALTLEDALCREWLISNGIGAYASSTAIGMNTRKYHGLLVAPHSTPSHRILLLSKLEEEITLAGKKYLLSTNQYPGSVFPEGYKHMTGFEFEDHPVFKYEIPGARITKEVWMPRGKNAVVVSYKIASEQELEFCAIPLVNGRDVHSTAAGAAFSCKPMEWGVRITAPHQFSITSDLCTFSQNELLYKNMHYEWEARRKEAGLDTHYSPGAFHAKLANGEIRFAAFMEEEFGISNAPMLYESNKVRLTRVLGDYYAKNRLTRSQFASSLVLAGDSFVAKRGQYHTIVAGYPWFSDWGRDAMVSIPGIAICTGRNGLAKEVIRLFLAHMKNGLIPNYFDSANMPHYNTSDASLWLINACHYLAVNGGELEHVKIELWHAMNAIMRWHIKGNQMVKMHPDGLLEVLDPQSTWMDAKVNGHVVTPRAGKPVEINALWYNALRQMQSLATIFRDSQCIRYYAELAGTARGSFEKFYNHKAGCLYDVIEPEDESVRPNQIFAVGLPFSPLSDLQQRSVFQKVQDELFTPMGLRTLSPKDHQYKEKYEGDQSQRDSAYHQGAVWPWLLGHYIDAYAKLYPQKKKAALSFFEPFEKHMERGCIGSVPELFEAGTLRADGCFSQAWSVAELLRAYTELSVENE